MRIFIKAPDDSTDSDVYQLKKDIETLKLKGYECVIARDYQELMNWEVTHPYLAKPK